jgi:TetR/AcrR family transcriptional regulator of autoinduction and epiphytic fitness
MRGQKAGAATQRNRGDSRNVVKAASLQAPRRRGRPREISEDERRRRLIAVAEKVFVEQGYGAASMNEVAQDAGMSKKTLYQLFDTKEALFAAVITDRMRALSEGAEKGAGARPLKDAVVEYLYEAACFILSPRHVALFRVLIGEAWRAPGMAQAFDNACAGRGKSVLARWLAEETEAGRLDLEDPVQAAGMLFGMVVGEPHHRMLMGEGRPPSRTAIEARVRKAVDIFLQGAQRRRSA